MAIYVVNKKYPEGYDSRSGVVVYIGRPSIFGNPYQGGTREEQIAFYRGYWLDSMGKHGGFRRAAENLLDIARTRDVYLVCWCAPKPCHGDIIKRWIEERLREEAKGERCEEKA
jgi:hypothetical protein